MELHTTNISVKISAQKLNHRCSKIDIHSLKNSEIRHKTELLYSIELLTDITPPSMPPKR